MSQQTIQDSIIRAPRTLTIASGVIYVTEQFHKVAGQSGLADDLDTINGGALGARLILQASSDTVNITIKHGTGNIKCHGSTDIILAEDDDMVQLVHNGTSWAASPFKVEVDPALGKAALWTATQAFADNTSLGFGNTAAAPDITWSWDGTRLNVAQATANSEIRWGVDGAGIDQRWYGDTASTFALWDQSRDTLALSDNGRLGLGTGAGAAYDIEVYWDGTNLVVAQLTANSAILWGASGAGIDHIFYGDTAGYNLTWDQSADALIFADNAKFILGTGLDLTALHDGTNTLFTSATGNFTIDNTAATGATIMLLGTDTNAVSFQVQNNSAAALLTVTPTSASGGTVVASGLRAVSATAAAITTTRTLTAADSGGVFSVAKTSAYAITLPTPAQGLSFKFMILDTGANAVTFSNGSAHLFGNITEAGTTPIAMTGTTITAAASGSVGDWIKFEGIDATHYLVTGSSIAASKFTVA